MKTIRMILSPTIYSEIILVLVYLNLQKINYPAMVSTWRATEIYNELFIQCHVKDDKRVPGTKVSLFLCTFLKLMLIFKWNGVPFIIW